VVRRPLGRAWATAQPRCKHRGAARRVQNGEEMPMFDLAGAVSVLVVCAVLGPVASYALGAVRQSLLKRRA
jgi:hypothetical protein